jgi:hypothetical protein
MRHIPRPTPALVVAILALLIAMASTAGAAVYVVPLAQRALLADNAKKLNGQTASQIVASVPSPQLKVAALVSVKSQPYSLNPDQQNDLTVTCDSGQKAISGGIDEAVGTAYVFDNRPSTDGQSWRIYVANFSESAPAVGVLYAVCIA